MKKLMVLFLSLTLITSSVFASTKTQDLKMAIDEFNYAMEVEWDQKDVKFYSQQLDLFLSKISALKLDQANNKQWLLEALSYLPQSNYKTEVMQALQIIKPEALTLDKTQALLREMVSKSEFQGASWIVGAATSIVVTAVILIVVLAILSNDRDQHEDGHQHIPPYTVEPEVEADFHGIPRDYGCDNDFGCYDY